MSNLPFFSQTIAYTKPIFTCMKSSYAITGTYTIYAIHTTDHLGLDVVYVGKTRSKDLRRVLRYHLEGHNYLTAHDFSVSPKPPTIHTLSTLPDSNAAIAYRHCLAWYRLAEEQGFVALASQKFDQAAYNMHPLTQEIFDQIQHTNIGTLLSIPYIPPKQEESKSAVPVATSPDLVQLNIKVSSQERAIFIDLCRTYKLTQREVFAMILSSANPSAAAQIIEQQGTTIEKLSATIEQLKSIPRGAKADAKLKEALAHYKTATSKYLELIANEIDFLPLSIKPLTWNRFAKQHPDRSNYEYPAEDGFSVIELKAICYGKTRIPAIFIWGTNVNSRKQIKLRFYNKQSYVGIPIPHSPFLYEDALLLVGYRRSSDGAMDLWTSFPLFSQANTSITQAVSSPLKEHLSLDELIQRSKSSNSTQ